jgi:hypothetical protein
MRPFAAGRIISQLLRTRRIRRRPAVAERQIPAVRSSAAGRATSWSSSNWRPASQPWWPPSTTPTSTTSSGSTTSACLQPCRKTDRPGRQDHGPGLYAVDRDGSTWRQLATATGSRLAKQLMPARCSSCPGTPTCWTSVGATTTYLCDQPVAGPAHELRYVNLIRLDTRTGAMRPVPRPAARWRMVLDHKGEPRLAGASKDGTTTLYYLDPATRPGAP